MTDTTVSPARIGRVAHPSQGCGCDFIAAGMALDVHDQLLGLELLTALEAVEICAELAICEMHEGFEPKDFLAFVAQHNSWFNAPSVARLAVLMDCLSAGFNYPSRSTVTVGKSGKVRVTPGR